MGYVNPLPTPLHVVQATIASVVGTKTYELVQTTDNVVLVNKDNDDDHIAREWIYFSQYSRTWTIYSISTTQDSWSTTELLFS
jgi:hypothetical protein